MTRDILIDVLSNHLEITYCSKPPVYIPDTPPLTMHHSYFMFQSKTVPSMSVTSYFTRLARYSGCSGEVLLLTLIHFHRLLHLHSHHFTINLLTIHRVLLTGVLCAAKFFDDSFLNNARYAKIGGISGPELNALEVELLFLLNFDLFVDSTEYTRVYHSLITNNPYYYRALSSDENVKQEGDIQLANKTQKSN